MVELKSQNRDGARPFRFRNINFTLTRVY
jgi:hypothetical protein